MDSPEEAVEGKKPDLNLSLSYDAPDAAAELSNESDASVSEPTAAQPDTAHQANAASEQATKGATVILNSLLSEEPSSAPWHSTDISSSPIQPLPSLRHALSQQAASTPLEPQPQEQAIPHTVPASVPVAFPRMDLRMLQTEVPATKRQKRRLSPPPGIPAQQLHAQSTDRQAKQQPDARQPSMLADAAFPGAKFTSKRADAHALLPLPVKQTVTDTNVDVEFLRSPMQHAASSPQPETCWLLQALARGIHADSEASAMEALRSYHDAQDKSPDAVLSKAHAQQSANSLRQAHARPHAVPQPAPIDLVDDCDEDVMHSALLSKDEQLRQLQQAEDAKCARQLQREQQDADRQLAELQVQLQQSYLLCRNCLASLLPQTVFVFARYKLHAHCYTRSMHFCCEAPHACTTLGLSRLGHVKLSSFTVRFVQLQASDQIMHESDEEYFPGQNGSAWVTKPSSRYACSTDRKTCSLHDSVWQQPCHMWMQLQ